MSELNAIARFFVNRSGRRGNRRRTAWIGEHLSLPPGARCLEIGCGNGEMAGQLVDRLRPSTYLATDLDLRQIEVARHRLAQRYPRGLPTGLELREANMLSLPAADASIDIVFAFSSIHHASPSHRDFSQVPVALAEIDRVLRPGGTLAYEEFVHLAAIRTWLAEHGYTRGEHARRWTRELALARKSS